jgi:hypothetical protein
MRLPFSEWPKKPSVVEWLRELDSNQRPSD